MAAARRKPARTAPPKPKPSPARRRLPPQRRRLEILRAAARVMRREGARAGIEAVVREAGVSRPAFYLYFPSWAHLVAELRAMALAEFEAQGAALFAPPRDDDWAKQGNALTRGFARFLLGLGGLYEALFQAPGAGGALAMEISRPLAGFLRAGAKAGGLLVDDPDRAARLICAVILETTTAIRAGEDRKPMEAAMGELVGRAFSGPR